MRYKEYKKVDIPWLDEVPSHWKIQRIASVFDIRKEKNDPIKTEEVLSLSAKYGVTPYSEKKEKGGNKPKSDLTKYNLCYEGDILVNCMNVVAGAVGISNYFGAVSPVYYPLVTNKYNNKYYMEYLFRNYDFQRGMVGLGKGIMMNESESGNLTTVRMRISWDTLKTLEIPVPSKEEQEQIARFLDWKINEIDRLIDKKKSKLWKLDTTNQLSIDKFYDSIESYEEIKLKILGTFLKNGNLSRNDEEESSKFSALLYGDMYTKYNYIFDEAQTKINKQSYYDNPIINGNTLFFTTSGETREEIGKCVLYTGEEEIAIGGDLVVFKAYNKINPKYLMYALNTSDAINYRYVNGRGEIIIHISQASLGNYKIRVPQMAVQEEISTKIEENIRNNNEIREKVKKQINNLKQLKQSLISDVVTGKVDVRNVAIPEYDKASNIEDDYILEENFEEEV